MNCSQRMTFTLEVTRGSHRRNTARFPDEGAALHGVAPGPSARFMGSVTSRVEAHPALAVITHDVTVGPAAHPPIALGARRVLDADGGGDGAGHGGVDGSMEASRAR